MAQQHDGGKAGNMDGQPGALEKPAPKKTYTTPVLVEYGTIAKLTQGSLTRNSDGGNSRRNMCL